MDMFFYLSSSDGGLAKNMFYQSWQVGLDIQSHSVRALAVQRRRNGWQLRHWWQHKLLQAVLRDGCLEHSDALIQVLRQWRVQLPKYISLRIALPAQRVLQQRMPQPDARLKEPQRNNYISIQGLKQFPLDGQTLASFTSRYSNTAANCGTPTRTATVAALFASNRFAAAGSRYHPLRAAGDGPRLRLACRCGAVALSRS